MNKLREGPIIVKLDLVSEIQMRHMRILHKIITANTTKTACVHVKRFVVSGNLQLTFNLSGSILSVSVFWRVIHCFVAGLSEARLHSLRSLWEFPSPSPSSTPNDTHMLWTADSLSESMTSLLHYRACAFSSYAQLRLTGAAWQVTRWKFGHKWNVQATYYTWECCPVTF